MNTLNLLSWILAYSFSLVQVTLFVAIYFRHKNKIELHYLIVLSNIFLITIVIMILIIFGISNFHMILLNILLSLYITVPLYAYSLFGVNQKYYKLIPILVATEAIIENILIMHGIFGVIYISRIVFYFLLLIPVFVNRKKVFPKDTLEWKIKSMSTKTAVILIAFLLMFIPSSLFLFDMPYASSLFWALFTLAYQIPGLLYCKNRLFANRALFSKMDISSLSKRENEVALAICKGYKYAEIAQMLFISLSAVKKHSYSIYRKLNINNNRELMHVFIKAQKEEDSTF